MIRNYFGNKYPYTDFHELNLDWILSVINDLREAMKVFVEYNEIKYADPILWDITTQYQQNTIVQDPQGNTYLSKVPVPAGIALTNTDYWLKVADFDATAGLIRQAISFNNDGASPISSANRAVGDLVWWNNILYEVIQPITAGSAYDATSATPNISAISLEQLISGLDGRVTQAETDIINIQNQLQHIKQTYYNILSYGAVGDGVTDCTQAIQNAIDDISTSDGGGKIYFPTGEYLVTNTIYLKSNVSLIGDGDSSIINFNNLPMLLPRGDRIALWANGSTDAGVAASPVVMGSDSVTVSNASTFAPGDLIEIYSTSQIFDYQGTADGAYFAEMAVIESISGNVLKLDHPNYINISADIYVRKITPVEGVTIENIKLIGQNVPDYREHGIYMSYCKNVIINHVTLVGFDWYSVGLVSTYNALVDGNNITGVYYDGSTGSIFYGVAVVNDCCHINVVNNYCTKERHLFVCVGYSAGPLGYMGIPYHVNVANNIAIGMMYDGGGVSYAYEHHGQGLYINIHDNIAAGCYAGVNIEGSNVTVENNTLYDCEVAGIIMGDAVNVSYIKISNNVIKPPKNLNPSVAGTRCGIWFNSTHVITADFIEISGNVIYYDKYNGIYMNDYPLLDSVISNNTFISVDFGATLVYAARLHCTYNYRENTFENNTILNAQGGIDVYGGRWVIKNNTICGSRLNTANYAMVMRAAAAAIKVIANVIDHFVYGIGGIGSPTIEAAAFNTFEGTGAGSFKQGVTITNENYNLAY